MVVVVVSAGVEVVVIHAGIIVVVLIGIVVVIGDVVLNSINGHPTL